jgi:hypothetical protein
VIRDVFEEDEIVKEWKAGKSDRTMPIEDLFLLIRDGFKNCDEHCVHRERYGEDACLCIRELFPSREFYMLYLELRDWYISRTAERIADAIIGDVK